MTDNTAVSQKRIVNELNFGAKTSRRVGWEAWEFAVESPHLVRVTNASYGFEKDDHSYLVGIEDRNGLLVPGECECPADKYNEEYDCKHKVALATVAGPVVLQAAVDCSTPRVEAGKATPQTDKERLTTDGGVVSEGTGDDSRPLNAEERKECDCEDLPDDFPCFACYTEREA